MASCLKLKKMKDDILFAERQRFNQWWLWLLILGINGVFFWGTFQQVIKGTPFGDHPMSNTGIVFTSILMLSITLLLFNVRLETIIKEEGIYVRFFPFHVKFKFYSRVTIKKAFIRIHNPLTEYGGYGIRLGIMGKGKAFNVSGNKGLQLVFEDDTKLLIGTNEPDQLMLVLLKLGY